MPEEDPADRALKRLFARRVKQLAKERNIKISHLPDCAALSRAQFYRILGGQSSATLKQIGRLAKALNVPPSELLKED